MRSLLFVPADNDRKLSKAEAAGADALALDLEDSVMPARKEAARAMLGDYLRSYRGASQIWIRLNDMASGELLKDLVAVAPFAPTGVILPKIFGPEEIDRLSHYLDVAEVQHGIAAGAISIIVVCTETPAAVLRMSELLQRKRTRLRGMIWGGEDLSAALGAAEPRAADGSWRPVYAHARVQCLLACHALDIEAIDTVYVDLKNADGCRAQTEAARCDGFTGKVAVHPDQVAIINQAFTPSAAEIEHAQRVVAAFGTGAGSVLLDGKMLDIPHLKSARRSLAAASVV